MTISHHIERFMGLPVRNFAPGDEVPLSGEIAYRLAVDYEAHEDGQTLAGLLTSLLALHGAAGVRALVVGDWGNAAAESAATAIAALAERGPRLPALRGLFFGEMIVDECEISWIQQADLSPLWAAFPSLEVLRVRGGEGLSLGAMALLHLTQLGIEAGGLDRRVVQQLCAAELPALEHLELWLGTDEYGGNVTLEDLRPILDGTLFPKLAYLGLRNSEMADEIAEALVKAPIVRRIHTLDLSLGNLTDRGAKALLALPTDTGLRQLDIHHHYVSPGLVDQLSARGLEVNASDAQEPDEDDGELYYYIAVSE